MEQILHLAARVALMFILISDDGTGLELFFIAVALFAAAFVIWPIVSDRIAERVKRRKHL